MDKRKANHLFFSAGVLLIAAGGAVSWQFHRVLSFVVLATFIVLITSEHDFFKEKEQHSLILLSLGIVLGIISSVWGVFYKLTIPLLVGTGTVLSIIAAVLQRVWELKKMLKEKPSETYMKLKK